MTDHTTLDFVVFKKSNKKDLADKTNQKRVIMLKEIVHELMDEMEKMERSMDIMAKQNTMMKNRLDELNSKQEENEQVMKIHEKINTGHKMWKKAQEEMKNKRKTWKIEQIKEQESFRKIIDDQEIAKEIRPKK